MNPKRYDRLLSGQTVAARKVLMAISTEEYWTGKKIYAELRRLGDSTRNLRVVEGCINTLVKAGLVHENPTGYFMRIQPTLGSTQDDLAEEIPVVEPVPVVEAPKPEPVMEPVKEEVRPFVHPEPFHLVVETIRQAPDPDYEEYLALRTDRAIKMLQLLSEHTDEETGLGLLEIAEDLDSTHKRQRTYFSGLGEQNVTRKVANPGWHEHIVDEVPYFSINEVLTEQDIEACRAQRKITTVQTEKRKGAEQIRREALFRKYEPNGEGNRPYYDSLLDKLKNHMPDIEPVAVVEVEAEPAPTAISTQQRRARRGLCDMKIPGISQAPEYRAWCGVIAPSNVNALAQQGLLVDARWQSFKAFLTDIGYRPEYGARLMRIDKEKGWYKENVEWRVGGKPVEPRARAPKGWPLMAERDNAERELNRIVQEARAKIDSQFG